MTVLTNDWVLFYCGSTEKKWQYSSTEIRCVNYVHVVRYALKEKLIKHWRGKPLTGIKARPKDIYVFRGSENICHVFQGTVQ